MYRCEVCGRVVEAGKPAHKQVVETRQREYHPRQESGGGAKKTPGRSRRRKGDPGGAGHEIVSEQLLCSTCAESASSGE